MNCIQELEAQNLQDSWSILYFGLAEYLLNQSEQGEELVRSAVRTYGELIGNREREQQRKKGIKTNLQNFYIWPQVCFEDPRLLEKQQRLNEQVALTDVIRCPFASSARRYGTEKVAKLFCEEFTAACIGAYTENIAQVNISEVLTEDENNRCRIASYFRPANSNDDYKMHFNSFEEPKTDVSCVNQTMKEAVKKWNICARFMVQAFCKENSEQKATELTAYKIAEFLKSRSKSMEQTLDYSFVKRNCALSIDEFVYFRKKLECLLKLKGEE